MLSAGVVKRIKAEEDVPTPFTLKVGIARCLPRAAIAGVQAIARSRPLRMRAARQLY
jgi:hypothetical protein